MSKMDGLRAMREARYQEAAARAPGPARVTPPSKQSVPRPSGTQASADEPDGPAPALCGHRNISGRTCTRDQGHASKSHRYS
jgi:hypothetical protein